MKAIVRTILGLSVTLLILMSFQISAEEVKLPVGQQAPEKKAIERPKNGMSKQQVEARFGEPRGWDDPVGEPPISSWEYEEFVVFFEHDLVLHSVLKTD